MATASEFDLSVASRIWGNRRKILTTFVVGGIMVFLSAFFWAFAVETLWKGEWDRALGWGIFAAFLDSGTFLSVWIDSYRWRPPATRLIVGPEGLTIRYPAKVRVMKWSDPKFKVVVEHLNYKGEWAIFESEWTWWPRVVMPLDVEQSLIAAAKQAGMKVERRKDPGSVSGECVRISRSSLLSAP